MKKRHIMTAICASYLAAWGLTVFFGDLWLSRSTISRANAEWQYFHSKGSRRYAWDAGPRVALRWVTYPAPFVVRAEVDRSIGDLNGKSSVSFYVVTPWSSWSFFEQMIWLS
jgi:hypothetical protein